MGKNKQPTYADLRKALTAFGYEGEQRGSHWVFRRAEGTQLAVLPMRKPDEIARPVHRKIVETTLSNDGVVSPEDFQFYLENGKLPRDMIQKGDKLVWTAPETGMEVPVVAAAGEKDGFVVIKQRTGTFSPCPVGELKKVS